jgi:hypothetical protein
MTNDLEEKAISLLKEEFDPDLEYDLTLEKTFDMHPLREPGLSAIFSFQPFQNKPDRYYVVTGNVLPMVYPDWNLTQEELWAVHLGMEYFIQMDVTEEKERNPSKLLGYLKMVSTVFQEQLYITLVSLPKIEKVYRFKDQLHVVGHYTDEDKVYSWIVGDIPHFVYKKELPAQVIWSLHMGRILLT